MSRLHWFRIGSTLGLQVLLASLLTGCAAQPPASPAAPGCVPVPVAAARAEPLASFLTAAVPAQLKQDTAAVQANVRKFVAKPSTSREKVAELEPLTLAVNHALAVMEQHHKREGRYRAADVRAARAAADAVAHFLDAQPPPRETPEP